MIWAKDRFRRRIMYDFEKGKIKFIRGGKYPQCHSVFIDDETRVIIDASSDEKRITAIQKEKPLDVLVNSHAHEDHLMYNYLFGSSAFWVHEADAYAFEDVANLVDCYGSMDEKMRQGWIDFLLNHCHYVPRKADRLLKDGETIELGDVRMEIVHTPGHTPGHLCFYFPDEKILFMADLDLVKAGPYYGDTGSSVEDPVDSLTRLKTYDCDTYLTAHGKGVYEGDPGLIDQYMAVIYAREEILVDYLRKDPRTLDEITEQGFIYGPSKTVGGIWDLSLSERAMMEKHLEFLIKRRLVHRDGDRFVLNG
jgi:glyoxylase-like metal-dependent hydrolase (beta-lactamase superfamily II)